MPAFSDGEREGGSAPELRRGRRPWSAAAVADTCYCLERTLPSPEENLAVDEALIGWCRARPGAGVLRLWEPVSPFVVLGHANAAAREVDVAACEVRGIPVLRRCSGGGAVLQGPGCLNYALVLRLEQRPELATVNGTHRFVMERHRAVVAELTRDPVRVEGISDLAIRGVKFSGNAQKRTREVVLFHGTFLLGADLELMERVLRVPSRRPAYRGERSHAEFVRPVEIPSDRLRTALQACWRAREPFTDSLEPGLERLLEERYRRPEWHRKF